MGIIGEVFGCVLNPQGGEPDFPLGWLAAVLLKEGRHCHLVAGPRKASDGVGCNQVARGRSQPRHPD